MMHKILFACFAVLFICGCPDTPAQQTTTPNIGLQEPALQQQNWQVPLNYDLNLLDTLLGGSQTLPTANANPTLTNNTNYVTANTSTVAITNLTAAYIGQTIRIFCGTGDVFTSLVSGSTISLNGAWSCSSNPSITLTNISGIWYEAGRAGATGGGGGGGLVDPGSNGIIKRTSLNTTAVAGLSDLTALGAVPNTITVNSHALSSNVTIGYSDLAAGALANGTTCTTQSPGDSTGKCASDQFVLSQGFVTGGPYVAQTTTVNTHALSTNITLGYSDFAAGAIANGSTVTTQSLSDSSTKPASTAFVKGQNYVTGGPYVATTTTVNGHALSSNVTVSASDISTGTLPCTQLPTFTGDVVFTSCGTQVTVTHLASALPVNQGGTGTTTPGLIPGTNVTITGTWPNQTINSSSGGGSTNPGSPTGAYQFNLSNAFSGAGGLSEGNSQVTSSEPVNIKGYLNVGGKDPWNDITNPKFGGRAVNVTIAPAVAGVVANCTASSPTCTISGTGSTSFQNGDGILILGAGAAQSMPTPGAPTVTSAEAAANVGEGIVVNAPAGGTTTGTCYRIAEIDFNQGLTAAGPETCPTTQPRGPVNTAIVSASLSNTTITYTTVGNTLAAGAWVQTYGTSNDFYFGRWCQVMNPTSTSFQCNTGLASYRGAPTSATGGTVTQWNVNHIVPPTLSASAYQYVVYAGPTGAEPLFEIGRAHV